MKDSYTRVSLGRICRLLGVTRQAYYQHFWQQESIGLEQSLVLSEVASIRANHRVMGVRKLHEMLYPFLLQHQIKMGRDALFDLLAANGLLIKRRRRRFITTYSNHWLKKWPNLIRDIQLSGPNQLWVSDITYLKLVDEFAYISLITDAYSHKVVGYHLSKSLEAVETLRALRMALSQLPADRMESLIHHSDRGIQYCSEVYITLLQKNRIEISMTENGDPRENAVAERMNGILKSEYLKHQQIKTFQQAEEHLQRSIVLYNEERPHMSIGLLTPESVHQKNLKKEKLWKNYYKEKSKLVNLFQDNEQPVN